jgi:tungstate transport system ATP-binding protein
MKPERALRPAILPLRLEGIGYAVGGTPLLSDVSLTVEAGRRLVVLGANGAGKSLLLRLCHGLIEPTSGRRRWADGAARAEAQAMVFQRPVLLRRSVAANLDYPLSIKGQVARRAAGHHRPHARPLRTDGHGGAPRAAPVGRRAATACAGPRLGDAATGAVPRRAVLGARPLGHADIEEMIESFSAEGITIVLTTHNLGQARRLAEDVAFLHRGRLIEHRAAADFFAGPCRPRPAHFSRAISSGSQGERP